MTGSTAASRDVMHLTGVLARPGSTEGVVIGHRAGRAAGVLAQLDRAATDSRFPDLNHPYSYAIDARMRAFGDATRWALVVETVGYNPRAANVEDVIHTFGNCLTSGRPGSEAGDFHRRIDNLGELIGTDEFGTYAGSAPLVVRGHAIDVDAPQGEDLFSPFRQLVPDHRELLLGDEAEVRRRLPPDVPELLQLQEWHQPDPFQTPPSRSEAYQLVAVVLETLDPAWYRPTLAPNTHWSNWPVSGSL